MAFFYLDASRCLLIYKMLRCPIFDIPLNRINLHPPGTREAARTPGQDSGGQLADFSILDSVVGSVGGLAGRCYG